jgi:hypothetical protein
VFVEFFFVLVADRSAIDDDRGSVDGFLGFIGRLHARVLKAL